METIGFIQSYKNVYDVGWNYQKDKKYEFVDSVVSSGTGIVYDFNEPINHYMWCNGATIHNCGEVTLQTCEGGGESCNLGSINLSKYYDPINDYDNVALTNDVRTAIRFLDKVIDKNFYPVPEIETMTKKFRRLGLGVMGWHDLLIKCGIPYDSDKALHMATDIMSLINYTAEDESAKMGGCNSFICNLAKEERLNTEYGQECRNIARTCIAPTGTIATIADCSYGIEPNFSYVYKRYTWVNGKKVGYKQIHPIFETKLYNLFPDDEDAFNMVVDHMYEHGTIQDLDLLPSNFKTIFKTALDIGYTDHIKMQATFQKYVDNNISKTVNLPSSATVQDVSAIYKLAWKTHLKGVTIYRSGSREDEVLELNKDDNNNEILMNMSNTNYIIKKPHRPKDLPGRTFKMQSGCGKLWVTVNFNDNRPYEVFVSTGGTGGCKAMADALGRMISLALRNELPTEDVVRQLRRVKCDVAMKGDNADGKSCADIVARCIEEMRGYRSDQPLSAAYLTNNGDYSISDTCILTKEEASPNVVCPECGEPIMLVEGCMTCKSCGWSRCK